MELEISLRRVKQVLICLLALVVTAGFWAEANDAPEVVQQRSAWIRFFSLSWEQNLPTWVSSLLLFSCSALLLLNALRARVSQSKYTAHWWGLSVIFLYISLDEFATIHEKANSWFHFGGVLYFGWVVPAAIVVSIIGVTYIGFLRHLPARSRYRFMLAGSIYVGGALGVELVLGHWTDLHGSHNWVYGLIDLLEESMELTGVALFFYSLLDHLGGYGGALRLAFSAPSSANSHA